MRKRVALGDAFSYFFNGYPRRQATDQPTNQPTNQSSHQSTARALKNTKTGLPGASRFRTLVGCSLPRGSVENIRKPVARSNMFSYFFNGHPRRQATNQPANQPASQASISPIRRTGVERVREQVAWSISLSYFGLWLAARFRECR